MSSVVDEQGRLFGLVNTVDVMIVLFLLALTVGFLALATPPFLASGTQTSVSATIETGVPGYSVAALNASGEPTDFDVHSISSVTILDSYQTNSSGINYNRTEYRVRFDARLAAQRRNGALYYRGDRLYVGRLLNLDLNTTIVTGEVVAIHPGQGASHDA